MDNKDLQKDFINRVNGISQRYTPEQVFTDFVEMMAISIQNSLYFDQEKENRYLDIISKYEPKEQKVFPELSALVALALENEFCDFLGNCFEKIGCQNVKAGQFFTPYHLSQLCANVQFDKQEALKTINEKGYISVNEPASGSGGMIIALMEKMQKQGINYQKDVRVITQDIDFRCCCMCYIQLSLLGVPAQVNFGNTLLVQVWQTLYTPMYAFNLSAKQEQKPKGQLSLF